MYKYLGGCNVVYETYTEQWAGWLADWLSQLSTQHCLFWNINITAAALRSMWGTGDGGRGTLTNRCYKYKTDLRTRPASWRRVGAVMSVAARRLHRSLVVLVAAALTWCCCWCCTSTPRAHHHRTQPPARPTSTVCVCRARAGVPRRPAGPQGLQVTFFNSPKS